MAKLTTTQKLSYITIFSRQFSVFMASLCIAISGPVLLSSTFHAENHLTIYDQSLAFLYSLTLSFAILAYYLTQKSVDNRLFSRRLTSNYTIFLATVLGIIAALALINGVTNVLGVLPTAAESKFGDIVFLFVQMLSLITGITLLFKPNSALNIKNVRNIFSINIQKVAKYVH